MYPVNPDGTALWIEECGQFIKKISATIEMDSLLMEVKAEYGKSKHMLTLNIQLQLIKSECTQ